MIQMIEECLRLLTLHLAWKARGLSLVSEPNEEETRFRETLEEQRGSVIEKLTEYAVGSDSRPCEGVKRAVRTIVVVYLLSFFLTSHGRHFTTYSICTSSFPMPSLHRAYPPRLFLSQWTRKRSTVVQDFCSQRLSNLWMIWRLAGR